MGNWQSWTSEPVGDTESQMDDKNDDANGNRMTPTSGEVDARSIYTKYIFRREWALDFCYLLLSEKKILNN